MEERQDIISRRDAIDALMEIMDRPKHADFLYTDEICKTLNELPSAQQDSCIDDIVSEIEELIAETKKNGKHHEIHVRINGAMICFGLQLALEIIEEKRAERREE